MIFFPISPNLLYLLLAFILFFFIRIVYVLYILNYRRYSLIQYGIDPQKPNANKDVQKPVRTMIILGSGGHTGEMIQFTDKLNRINYCPLIYVYGETDKSSRVRIEKIEADKNNTENVQFYTIYRAREVGQSYFTSIFSTLYSIFRSITLVYTLHPQLILCNGPGTCLPLVCIALLYRAILFRPCKIIFVESFCRVDTLSLCGWMLYYFVDRFIVQWPQLAKKYKLTEYIGRLM